VLHDGPVPSVADAELRVIRARFLSDQGWVAYDQALADLETRDQALAAAERLVLWFEHDLYDQLQIVQVLASSHVPAELVQAATYLNKADLESLVAAPVTAAQRTLARRAWAALCAPDPSELEALAAEDANGLPFLRPALLRLLEEYPAVRGGLGASERLALEAVAEGARTRAKAFVAAQAHEEPRFLGDLSFYAILDRLEPLVGRDPDLHVTELGARVLAGTVDFVTDRWIGGVAVRPPAPPWRWHDEDRRLVTILAT
jgi:hypothetical protein